MEGGPHLDTLFQALMGTQAALWPLINDLKAKHYVARRPKKKWSWLRTPTTRFV